jgi:hypothetical protein
MVTHQKFVLHVVDHLSGVKNGHEIGTTFAGVAMLVAHKVFSSQLPDDNPAHDQWP